MLHFILFILICYGLTNILLYGSVFDKIRPNTKLFSCSLCMGFHSGWIVLLLSNLSGLLSLPYITFIDYIFAGCLSSGTTYMLDKLIGDHGFNIKNNYDN